MSSPVFFFYILFILSKVLLIFIHIPAAYLIRSHSCHLSLSSHPLIGPIALVCLAAHFLQASIWPLPHRTIPKHIPPRHFSSPYLAHFNPTHPPPHPDVNLTPSPHHFVHRECYSHVCPFIRPIKFQFIHSPGRVTYEETREAQIPVTGRYRCSLAYDWPNSVLTGTDCFVFLLF